MLNKVLKYSDRVLFLETNTRYFKTLYHKYEYINSNLHNLHSDNADL